jgi:hypothetical protein
MTRIDIARKLENRSLAWDKKASALVFAAVLIILSVTVGCSSDKPKPETSNNQIPVTQPQSQPQMQMPVPVAQAESKPAPKKPVVRKKPATVNYTDKTYGVTFEYPRRYAIETGDAASELIQTSTIPMNFVAPGGVALAAVELPETGFVNTDFSSAFFNVSVHKNLSADQCNEFAVPQPKAEVKSETATPTTEIAKQDSTPKSETATSTETKAPENASSPKLMVGDLELRATEAVSGEGTRQSDSKYFHVYQNGACYEFALNVRTDASAEGLVKHVDRDKVFNRLEQILATVKINPVTPEVTAEAPSAVAPQTPAQ